jgi:hypothetical protein
MSEGAYRHGRLNRFRNARPERGMRTAAIVMNGELGDGPPQMAFIDGNDVIEALAPNRSELLARNGESARGMSWP